MKKFVSFVMAFVLCTMLTLPAYASNDFTPSVSNKPAPDVVPVIMPDGDTAFAEILDATGEVIDQVYEECLVITSVANAAYSEATPDNAKELLLDVYQKLQSGEMTIPYVKLFGDGIDADNMVISDLFDVSLLCEEHPEALEPIGTTMRITFDLGVGADENVYATLYKCDGWVTTVDTKNNGDGTVSIIAEDFCPVAFSVAIEDDEAVTPPVKTDDPIDSHFWIVTLTIACISLTSMIVFPTFYSHSKKSRGK